MVKVILTEVQTASFVPSLRLSSTLSLHLRHTLPSSNPGWSPWNKSYRLFQPALDPLDDPGWIPICPPWPESELKRRSSATHSNPFSSPAPRVFHLQPQGLCIQRGKYIFQPNSGADQTILVVGQPLLPILSIIFVVLLRQCVVLCLFVVLACCVQSRKPGVTIWELPDPTHSEN